jgi:hypothetical protein
MELPVRRLAGIVLVALIVLATWGQAPNAQTSDKSGQKDGSSSGGVADQLRTGAQRIGEGATRIGEGIKQGAIQTWEAVKAGASAAADKLPGGKSAPKSTVAPSPRSDAPPAD